MRILSIGNSFSVDAQTYVNRIASAGGEDLYLGDLYIGGCPLERHMNNVNSGEVAYQYYINAESVGETSIETALKDGKWDYVTLQQASGFSGQYETYEPYLEPLAQYVKKLAPEAKICIHETWAYEKHSTHPHFAFYDCDQNLMHEKLSAAYERAARTLNARIIPVGNAIMMARQSEMFDVDKGGESLSRDGFHLSLIAGRYLAGAVWYEVFTGKDVRENSFVPARMEFRGTHPETGEILLEPIRESIPSEEKMKFLRECAHRAVAEIKG